MIRLARYLKNYRKECVWGPLFKFLEAFFELLLPTVMALVVNQGVEKRDAAVVVRLGGLMVLMAVCGFCSASVCQYFAARASQGFGTDLRNDVFRHILRYSYAQLDGFGAPTLINRITNDVNQLQQWVAMMIRLVPRAPFICVGAIILSFFLDPQLALLLLAATPVLGGVIFVITKFASPLYRAYQKRLDGIARVLRENLSGVRVIRAFAKTGEETARFCRANDGLVRTGFRIGRISSFFNPLTALTVNMVVVLLLWFGGVHIDAGRLSQGQIIAFINYVSQILYALLVVSNLIILLTKAMASAARVNEVLDTRPDRTKRAAAALAAPAAPAALAAPTAPATLPQAPAVEFRDVSFGYSETGEKALEHITLRVKRGETLGVIGGTGSGKTTLVNLIGRFYDADSGAVLVDGTDVRDLPPPELRRKVGLVPQKALLFSGTVAENIRWGKRDAGSEAVAEAARTAQADEFIRELPQGYDTPVSRGGANFSGGQRQRLTIARALAADPEILILDDASSALDFLTDARLRAAIREKGRDKTVILISQRAGALRSADRILVLEDGKTAGLGTHEELIRRCGVYREICLSQLSAQEAGL